MRWRQTFLDEAAEKLIQMGLKGCSVCSSNQIAIHPWPLMGEIGDLHSVKEKGRDTEHSVLFFLNVECHSCGHTLLFNSERFRPGSHDALIVGLTPEQEAELEEQGPE